MNENIPGRDEQLKNAFGTYFPNAFGISSSERVRVVRTRSVFVSNVFDSNLFSEQQPHIFTRNLVLK